MNTQVTSNENLTVNYPEMWGNTTDAIQAEFTILGKYRITSKAEIKLSRGIESNGVVSEFGANNVKNKRAGYYIYIMTEKAFEKFCENNKVTINQLLD